MTPAEDLAVEATHDLLPCRRTEVDDRLIESIFVRSSEAVAVIELALPEQLKFFPLPASPGAKHRVHGLGQKRCLRGRSIQQAKARQPIAWSPYGCPRFPRLIAVNLVPLCCGLDREDVVELEVALDEVQRLLGRDSEAEGSSERRTKRTRLAEF